MTGRFITLEGLDGCGKTLQWKRLGQAATELGIAHTLVREPGGSRIGDLIRALIIDPANTDLDPKAEVFLFLANRAQNLASVVRPAIAENKVVFCDRHRDSSTAFQGGGRELGVDWVDSLNDAACGDTVPDCTLLLSIPVDISLARARARSAADRFESEQRAFHERIAAAYQQLADRYPNRFVIIDAQGSKDEVTRAVFAALAYRYPDILGKLANYRGEFRD